MDKKTTDSALNMQYSEFDVNIDIKSTQNPYKEKMVISMPTKQVVLILTSFDAADIDVDDTLRIDYANLIGEMLTFPVILNRISLLRAEASQQLSALRHELDQLRVRLETTFIRNNTERSEGPRGGIHILKPAEAETKHAVLTDPVFINMNKKVIRYEKYYSQIDAWFWAAKDKSKILESFSAKIKPEELENEILEGSINGIKIKVTNKLIS